MAVDGVETVDVNYDTKIVTCKIKDGASMDTVKAGLKTGLKKPYGFVGWQ